MKSFEAGKKYYCRSMSDYDTKFIFTVVSRTAKTVTGYLYAENKTKRCGIRTSENGIEKISPLGRYSMSPTIYANSEYTKEENL